MNHDKNDKPGNDTMFRQWRMRMGLSQRAAAAALGLTLATWQSIERGAPRYRRARDEDLRTRLACAALEAGIAPIANNAPQA